MKKLWTVMSILLVMAIFACDSGNSKKDKDDEKKKSREVELVPYDGEPVLLRYKMADGDTYKYSFDFDMEMDLGPGASMTMEMYMDGVYDVDTVYEDGDVLAVTSINRVKFSIDGMPGAEMSYDSEKSGDRSNSQFAEMNVLVDDPVPVLITPTGEMGDLDANPHARTLTRMSSMYGNAYFKQLIESSFQQLCENPVTVGDIYEGGNISTAGSTGEMNFEVTYLIKSISEDERYVVLVPQGEIDNEMITKADMYGEILFDVEDGMIEESFMEMDMTMEVQGQKVDMTVDMNFKILD